MKDDAIPPRRAWQKSLEWGKTSKTYKTKSAQTTKNILKQQRKVI